MREFRWPRLAFIEPGNPNCVSVNELQDAHLGLVGPDDIEPMRVAGTKEGVGR